MSDNVGPDLIQKLEEIREHLERYIGWCREGRLRIDEIQQQTLWADAAIQQAFPDDSLQYRIFDRRHRERTDFWMRNVSGYAETTDCDNLEYRVETVKLILEELDPEFLRDATRPKMQFYIPAGDVYRGKRIVFDLMKRAESELKIVDQFLDEESLVYVASLPAGVAVKLITANKKPIFPSLLNALRQERTNLEARECSECHDRFLVIDHNHVWHFGASLNGVGKKAFMINRVTDNDELSKFLEDADRWWQYGTPV